MTLTQANRYLCIILESVTEASKGSLHGMPSGHLYAALMGGAGLNLGEFQTLMQIAKEKGLVTESRSNLVTITPTGLEMVAKIRAFNAGT